jgi:hypothetical protein
MRSHASKGYVIYRFISSLWRCRRSDTGYDHPGIRLNSIDVRFLLKLLDIRQVRKGFALMRRAAIVGPLRTPIGTFGGSLRPLTAAQLATTVIKAVVARSGSIPI